MGTNKEVLGDHDIKLFKTVVVVILEKDKESMYNDKLT